MARRKKRSNKPNLPDSVLERARRNAGVIDDEPVADTPKADDSDADDTRADAADEVDTSSSKDSESDESDSASVAARASRRRNLSTVQLERSRKRGELTNEMMEEALINPTIIVTEEELREDYSHVLADLRNMAILAAILITGLLTIGFLVPAV